MDDVDRTPAWEGWGSRPWNIRPLRTVVAGMTLIPRSQAPKLSLPLTAGGSTDDLSLGSGVDGRFTLVLFFRGLHCPVCRKQLSELERRLDEIRSAGVGRVVAVSMESAERSAELVESWRLERLSVAYGMKEESARQWGLFISTSIKDGELPRFNEPGMFVLDADHSLYWSSVATMPFGRPALDDVLGGLRFAQDNDYPARGAA